MLPWQSIDRFPTDEGPIELRRRGGDFIITIAGRVLMSNARRNSEEELASAALAPEMRDVLVAGLGMGLTLRAALGTVGPRTKVVVRELHERIADWCRGPLAEVNGNAVFDRRVTVEIGDVRAAFGAARWDAIVLDLYEGPYDANGIFGAAGLAEAARGLRPGGVYAVWSEAEDRSFEKRLRTAGFTHEARRVQGHTIWICRCKLGG